MNIHQLRHHHEASWRRSYPEFIKVVRSRGYKIGVEVGVAFGGHAEALLEHCNLTRLFGVDPYRHDPGYQDTMNLPQAEFDRLFWYVIGRLSRFPAYAHVRETSAAAAASASANFDFVYIDADHSYPAVYADLRLWTPKVRKGGIIAGHDYDDPQLPDVKRAVDEFCAQEKLILHVEPAWVWWAEKQS